MKVFDYLFYKWYQGFKDFTKQYQKQRGIEGMAALGCMSLFFFFNLVSIVKILKKLEIGVDFMESFRIGPIYYFVLCLLLFARYYQKSRYKKVIQKYEIIDAPKNERTTMIFLIYIGLSFALFFFSIFFRLGY